jgi:hypothetical protein
MKVTVQKRWWSILVGGLFIGGVSANAANDQKAGSRYGGQAIVYKKAGDPSLLIGRPGDFQDLKLTREDVGRFDISPNGECVAFEERHGTRSIHVVSITAGKAGRPLGVFKRLRDPRWTAGGRGIYAQINDYGKLSLALVDLDGQKISTIHKECMSPVGADRGQHVLCQDATNLFVVGKDGATLESVRLKERIPNLSGKMPSPLDISVDERRVLFEVSVRDPSVAWHDGSKSEVYVWDRKTTRVTRLSPANMFAREPRWFGPDDSWLFVGFELSPNNTKVINSGRWPVENLYLVSRTNGERVEQIAAHVDRYSVTKPGGAERSSTRDSPFRECASE